MSVVVIRSMKVVGLIGNCCDHFEVEMQVNFAMYSFCEAKHLGGLVEVGRLMGEIGHLTGVVRRLNLKHAMCVMVFDGELNWVVVVAAGAIRLMLKVVVIGIVDGMGATSVEMLIEVKGIVEAKRDSCGEKQPLHEIQ